jgi:hypothetical protein
VSASPRTATTGQAACPARLHRHQANEQTDQAAQAPVPSTTGVASADSVSSTGAGEPSTGTRSTSIHGTDDSDFVAVPHHPKQMQQFRRQARIDAPEGIPPLVGQQLVAILAVVVGAKMSFLGT